MLFIEKDPAFPLSATLLSDLRDPINPHVVCILKARYIYCKNQSEWVLDTVAPAFQTVDCWRSNTDRQVTELVPEKRQAELLLWGEIRPQASIIRFDKSANRQQTIVKTGRLAPTPILYWQSDWQLRTGSKNGLKDFLVAPSYGRLSGYFNDYDHLQFNGLFDEKSAINSVFFLKNVNLAASLKTLDHPIAIPFQQDTLLVNTTAATIDCLWRARFPWDLMQDQKGILQLKEFFI